MHDWGDEGVDWKGIDDAAEFIGVNLRKFGRINVTQYKEKFGTVRVYCCFGVYQLHNLTHPGYVYSQYPKWLWDIDTDYGTKIIPFLFNWFMIPYQRCLYRFLYKKAIKKWPHLKKEILCCADFNELLTGV